MNCECVAIVDDGELVSIRTEVETLDLPIHLDQWDWEVAIQCNLGNLNKEKSDPVLSASDLNKHWRGVYHTKFVFVQ